MADYTPHPLVFPELDGTFSALSDSSPGLLYRVEIVEDRNGVLRYVCECRGARARGHCKHIDRVFDAFPEETADVVVIELPRCQAMTLAGRQCRNTPWRRSIYCGRHQHLTWELSGEDEDDEPVLQPPPATPTPPSPPWYLRKANMIAFGFVGFVTLLLVCTMTLGCAAPVASVPPTAERIASTALPTPTAPPSINTEQCDSIRRDLIDALRRVNSDIAKREAAIANAAAQLNFISEPLVVDIVETELGGSYDSATRTMREARDEFTKTLKDAPRDCLDIAGWSDAVFTYTGSPTFDKCNERRTAARDALPEDVQWAYLDQVDVVLDIMAEDSPNLDYKVAHQTLGGLVHADHLMLQEGANRALTSLCGAKEWNQAADELGD